MDSRWLDRPLLRFGLLVLVTGLMQQACWDTPLYTFDDPFHVYTGLNGSVRKDFGWPESSTYFPITLCSYRMDYVIFGPALREPSLLYANPPSPPVQTWIRAMRAMNGLYHIIAAFCLWAFLRRIEVKTGSAALITLLWAASPLACESVCWIAERKNVLAAMFGFGALLAWSAPRGVVWRWPLVSIFYALAVMSKPSALGVFPVLVALEMLDPLNREFNLGSARSWLKLALRLAVPLLVTIAGIVVNMHGHQYEIVESPGGNVFTAMLTDTNIFSRYIFNILLPIRLSFFYGVDAIGSLADTRLLIYVPALLVTVGVLYWGAVKEQRRYVLLGLLWFFGSLGPNSNLIAIPFWMQDRYAYIPAAGLLLAFIIGMHGLLMRLQERIEKTSAGNTEQDVMRGAAYFRSAVQLMGGAYLALILTLLCMRATVFADYDSLVLDAANKQPNSGMAQKIAARQYAVACYAFSPNGGSKKNTEINPRLAQVAAQQSINHYEQALQCTDIYHFDDPFTLRTEEAEFLVFLQRFDQAEALLKNWLPPAGMMKLWPFDNEGHPIPRYRLQFSHSFPPETLIKAWHVMAEAELRRCADPHLSPSDKLKICAKALECADHAIQECSDMRDRWIKVMGRPHELIDETELQKGRILTLMRNLYQDTHQTADAARTQAAAIQELMKIPERSPCTKMKHRLLADLQQN